MKTLGIWALGLAVAAGPAGAREWRVLTTPQFRIIGDASDGTLHDVATNLKDVMYVLDKVLVVDPAAREPLTMVVFDRQSELNDCLPLVAPGKTIDDVDQERDVWTSAISGKGPDWFVVAAASQDYDFQTRRAINQGAASWYVSAFDYRLPLAVSTGFSYVIATFKRQSNHGELGRAPERVDRMLGNWQLIPVSRLLTTDDESTIIDAQERVTFNIESWGLVHYLMFGTVPSQRHAMGLFLAALKQHRSPMQALADALGEDGASRIDASLNVYLHSAFMMVRLPMPPDTEDTSPLIPAGRAEVQMSLAKAALFGRPDAAVTHADYAVAAEPNQPDGYGLRAQIMARSHQPAEEVEAAVEKAMTLGSHDSWVLTHAAEEHLTAADDPAPAQVRSAIRLAEHAANYDHNYRPAFDFIAQHLWRCPPIASDAAFLAFARTRFPSDRWILVGQAAIARAQGDASQAGRLMAQARGSDPLLAPDQLAAVQSFVQ